MANVEPFNQLTGALKVYLGPIRETIPAVNAAPAGNWVLLGATDGDQTISNKGAPTFFRDNDHTGPVKGVRPEEDVTYEFTLVGLTLENWSRLINQVGKLTQVAGPPQTTKMPMKRGQVLTEYALLMTGAALSPYGALPGQWYVSRCVQASEPQAVFGKGNRPGLAANFTAVEDDTLADDDRLGYLIVQKA